MGFSAFQTISSTKTKDFIQENIVFGEFAVVKPKNFQFLKYNGIFPRTVQIGEILFTSDVLTVVSPISGYAQISKENPDTILINMNGVFLPKENQCRDSFTLKSLIEKILKNGNSSMDFSEKTLVQCINEFSGEAGTSIILSPFTKDNTIDFRQKILHEFSVEFELFKKNIQDLFPKSTVADCVSEKIKFHYPLGTPQYFLFRLIKKHRSEIFRFEENLFLGAETLYYLLRSLYRENPFYERLCSISTLNKRGKFQFLQKPLAIRNGQNISFLGKFLDKKVKYFSLNSIFDSPNFQSTQQDYFFDIYNDYSLVFIKENPRQKKSLPCIDCNDCNYFCPLYLEPRNILDNKGKDFQAKYCIECGICTVFCPSKIDFRSKIIQLKNEKYAVA